MSGRVLRFHPQCPFLDYGRERKNLLRASSELPLFSTAKECRRLLLVAQEQDYERFLAENAALKEKVSGHVLA